MKLKLWSGISIMMVYLWSDRFIMTELIRHSSIMMVYLWSDMFIMTELMVPKDHSNSKLLVRRVHHDTSFASDIK